MIRHLLKLAWHRKRTNTLLVVEMFFSFFVVFAVALVALHMAHVYRRPLGFSWRSVWDVQIDAGAGGDVEWEARQLATLARVLREVTAMPEIEAAAGAHAAPYDASSIRTSWDAGGRTVRTEIAEVTDGFRDVLGLEIVSGRWFEPSDSALSWRPVVIDRELSRDLFGTPDGAGRTFPTERQEAETRVIGVVSDFRKSGEFSSAGNFLFHRVPLDKRERSAPRSLLVRLRPGVGTAFEEELARRLRDIAPEWSYEIRSLEQMRESSMRLRLAPVLAVVVVAAFLLLMVGLGLMGVLWQNVVQRTREIGLRRATGASARDVRRQILTELLLLTTLGLALGTIVVLQLPLLDVLGFIEGGVFTASLVLAAVTLYALATICGLYPSWLATRVHPAEALHYE